MSIEPICRSDMERVSSFSLISISWREWDSCNVLLQYIRRCHLEHIRISSSSGWLTGDRSFSKDVWCLFISKWHQHVLNAYLFPKGVESIVDFRIKLTSNEIWNEENRILEGNIAVGRCSKYFNTFLVIWELRIEFLFIFLPKSVELASAFLDISVLASPQPGSSHTHSVWSRGKHSASSLSQHRVLARPPPPVLTTWYFL